MIFSIGDCVYNDIAPSMVLSTWSPVQCNDFYFNSQWQSHSASVSGSVFYLLPHIFSEKWSKKASICVCI